MHSANPHIPPAAPANAPEDAPVPLAQPHLTARERNYVQDVLNSSRLSRGPWLERFEQQMAEVCGTRHAIAVSSGTAALHCIVRALGLGSGDTVITTPFSFVASSNVLLYEGVRPRFVDINPRTYNIDVERVQAAIMSDTRGILAVDVFGVPANWPALTELADAHDLALVDDACEALGSSVDGRPIGQWGDAAAFGFYPNKQITTGEGGCITTDSAALAHTCRSLRNQGRADDGRMTHERLGYNYRMSELAAALGCAQLERLPELADQRRTVTARYRKALAPLTDDLALPPDPPNGTAHRFVYVVRLRDHFTTDARDQLMDHLQAEGIGCAPYFPPIHLQPLYRDRFGFEPGAFPACESVSARTLALPFYPTLRPAQIDRVADALRDALPHLPRR